MVFDTKQPGLGVRVTQRGKTFFAQWTCKATGQKRREVFGLFGAITVAHARAAAAAHLGDVAKGLDPRAERLARAEAGRKMKEAAKLARE
ncbi:MAG: integrase arm-type DNA-binding domain-containing protein, partial [Alphaproteobacteria bacterium]